MPSLQLRKNLRDHRITETDAGSYYPFGNNWSSKPGLSIKQFAIDKDITRNNGR